MSNLLASEPSAYLRSAAHQPVHWHPWGEAAFQRARAEDKPVLLDIGAVWCHWCHVMDGESYEDPEVAGLLNREFVCVKVDRDERLAASTSATAAPGRRPSFPTPRAAISCSPAGTTRARAGCARWSRRASPGWRGAASATMWAAGSTATRWTSAGSCRTSRRCRTTTRSCCAPT